MRSEIEIPKGRLWFAVRIGNVSVCLLHVLIESSGRVSVRTLSGASPSDNSYL